MNLGARTAVAACLWVCGCTGPAPSLRGLPAEAPVPLLAPLPPLPRSPELDRCLAETAELATLAAKPGGADHVVVGGCAQIVFENTMGVFFGLRSVHVDLDGTTLLEQSDPPEGPASLIDVHEMPVFVGQVAPGDHDVHVVLIYVSRAFGIYSYTRDYKFTARSTQTLTVTAGHPLQLQIVAYEKGGPTTPIEERPAVRFVVGTEGSPEGH